MGIRDNAVCAFDFDGCCCRYMRCPVVYAEQGMCRCRAWRLVLLRVYQGKVGAVRGEIVSCCHICWSSGVSCLDGLEVDEVASAHLFRSNCGATWRGLSGGDVAGVVLLDDSGVDRTDGYDGLKKIGLGVSVYIYSSPPCDGDVVG